MKVEGKIIVVSGGVVVLAVSWYWSCLSVTLRLLH